MPGVSTDVPPISAEIESAQNALVAVRDGALRGALLGRSSGRVASPSPRDTKRRPDSAWLALEERVAAQVSNLHQKYVAEQLDAERILRASMTRLESRVRTLEGQGVRSDRRVAEIQGLVQALTEEQRALLIRLDRLEENTRCARQRDTSGVLPDEWLRRLNRLEREQRATSLNLRLVVSVTEEAQQRQQKRLRCIEDRLQCVRSPGDGAMLGSARGANCVSTAALNKRTAELSAAEQPFSLNLEASQNLLRRCEEGNDRAGSVSPPLDIDMELTALRKHIVDGGSGNCQSEGDFLTAQSSGRGTARHHHAEGNYQELSVQLHELGQNMTLRMDTVEARVQALRDTVDELRARMESTPPVVSRQHAQYRAASVVSAVDDYSVDTFMEEHAKVGPATLRTVMDMLRRVEAQEIKITEIRTQLALLPSHESITSACKQVQVVVEQELGEFKLRFEPLEASLLTLGQNSMSHRDQIQFNTNEAVDRMNAHFEAKLSEVSSQVSCFTTHERVVEVCSAHVDSKMAEIRNSISALATREHVAEVFNAVACVQAREAEHLRVKLEERVLSNQNEWHEHANATCRRLDAHADAIDNLRQSMDTITSRNDNDNQLLELSDLEVDVGSEGRVSIGSRMREHGKAISELRERISDHQKITSLHAEFNELRKDYTTAFAAMHSKVDGGLRAVLQWEERATAVGQRTDADQHALTRNVQAHTDEDVDWISTEFVADVKELRSEVDGLQEVVDKQIVPEMWRIGGQLPEALQKVDRLLTEHAERTGKTEEHEIRLNILLTKLGIAEEKVQSCMDRLERHPSSVQLRSMWRDDIHKQLDEVDVAGLWSKVDVQGQSVDEIGDRLQDICRRFKCMYQSSPFVGFLGQDLGDVDMSGKQ